MRRIGITQRVEIIPSYGESRDCLDQRWSDLALTLGFLPIPLPNISSPHSIGLIDELELDAVIFSGGNSLTTVAPDDSDASIQRDAFEESLFSACLEKNIPTLAVCRGMQHINLLLGGNLTAIEKHVGTPHTIIPVDHTVTLPTTVNSYHNWCIPSNGLATSLSPLGTDKAGNIEAYRHQKHKILGLMWHPEREVPFCDIDIQLIKSILL
ncbi:Gamma-glutamyl-CDP-amidate hydrolase [Sinobacterium norvegicum]|uniref:Gamma-glutamyl-CDP-amidate hydrolase n=1 Tax=Sinobacterium norvegicum TaxID=1641715 RepID=A0ABN8EIY4_9GAMM|nr:gamma-glutamyl-gamma-aminobutyrate hydrolase family protein [Sinobacterium norvegicum]CAH0992014.1 Gamma-glutamyl-CDP-amidate hydrolase [Sinobacterium norvegicum]